MSLEEKMKTLIELNEEEIMADLQRLEDTRASDFAEMETSIAEQSDNHVNVGDSMISGNEEQDLEDKRPMKVRKIKNREEHMEIEKLVEETTEKMQISEMASLKDKTCVAKKPMDMTIRANEEERASLQQLRSEAISLGVDLSLLVAQLLFLVSDDELAIKQICSADLRSYKIKDPKGAVASRYIDVLNITVKKIHAQKKEQKEGQKGLVSLKQIVRFMFLFCERVQCLEDIFLYLRQPVLDRGMLLLSKMMVDNHRKELREIERKINDLKLEIFGNDYETNGFSEEEMTSEMVELWRTLFGQEERKRGRESPSQS